MDRAKYTAGFFVPGGADILAGKVLGLTDAGKDASLPETETGGRASADPTASFCVANAVLELDCARESTSLAAAVAQVYKRLATRKRFRSSAPALLPIRSLCDAGLGGLARWLRAAGYEADWVPNISDDGEAVKHYRTASGP